jgi:hypothetical protein
MCNYEEFTMRSKFLPLLLGTARGYATRVTAQALEQAAQSPVYNALMKAMQRIDVPKLENLGRRLGISMFKSNLEICQEHEAKGFRTGISDNLTGNLFRDCYKRTMADGIVWLDAHSKQLNPVERAVVAISLRNAAKVQARAVKKPGDPEDAPGLTQAQVDELEARNLAKYGDKIGPNARQSALSIIAENQSIKSETLPAIMEHKALDCRSPEYDKRYGLNIQPIQLGSGSPASSASDSLDADKKTEENNRPVLE